MILSNLLKICFMKKIIIPFRILILVFSLFLAACSGVENNKEVDQLPPIFPDYIGVTVPTNIAPLTFTVQGAESVYAEFYIRGEKQFSAKGNGKNGLRISEKKWNAMLSQAKGSSVEVVVFAKKEAEEIWSKYKSFSVFVAEETVDSHITYRLIKPGYELWDRMGIYQRDVSSYDERAIFRNSQQEAKEGRGCVNCHSFCEYNPDTFMFHVRMINAGTAVVKGDDAVHLNLKTELTQNGTYPKWHPSSRYIAYALCNTLQVFHAFDKNRISVYDTKSDFMIYDVEKREVIVDKRFLNSPEFETFPSWSPDGKWLYFSSAKPAGELPFNNDKMKYSILRVPFDETTAMLGDSVECVIDAEQTNKTQLFARISPNGKYLLYTEADYGTFPIWHHEAELKMLDLQTKENVDVDILNSSSVESYHSWSSNGHWVVFSSRRIDGLYTRLYLAYFDGKGNFHKPFLLPQSSADFDLLRMQSYNIPEFTKGATKMSSREIEKLLKGGTKPSKLRK